MQEITHGALFSGSGGFELAARMCGIKSLWASEIEPFPIKVTKSRFPEMQHIGDIGMVNGAELPPVDIVSGGSPCQDMSIAGRRQGLKGVKRPKDEKAVRRWMKNPASDTELYKMWGNGIALPCVLYVFEGIALQINSGDSHKEQ